MSTPSLFKRVGVQVGVFVNKCFGEFGSNAGISCRDYAGVLLFAAVGGCYVETVSKWADSLHRRIKNSYEVCFEDALFDLAVRYVNKWRGSHVSLAVDITDEPFYGNPQGLWIHKWTGENGVTGKFKFLTISVINSEKDQNIPLISVPVSMGQNISSLLERLLKKATNGIKPKVLSEVLLDRGFYTAKNIRTFEDNNWPYIIFVPKHEIFKNMLASTEDWTAIKHQLILNGNKTKQRVNTNIILVKNYLDNDWVFATNINLPSGKTYVRYYKKRWKIETQFRIEDEARIKTKSTNPLIRYFYYLISQVAHLFWRMLACQKIPFKTFIILSTNHLQKTFLKEKHHQLINQ